MLSYQDTVNKDLSERSGVTENWESIEEIDAIIREKYMSYPTNFSRSIFIPNPLFSSDRSAKYAETKPKSGVFYGHNAQQSDVQIKSEECVDLEQLLAGNSDESDVPSIAIGDDIDLYNNFDHHKGADNNPFIFNKSNNSSINCKSDYTKYSNNIRSGHQSTCTSASQSPTNVLSMNGSPNHEYCVFNAPEVTAENTIDGNFFNDAIYENMLGDDKLLYTPDNSWGLPIDFTNTKMKKQPLLTLDLKGGTFVNNEEINTPNIIDSIIKASEQQSLQFVTIENDIFNQDPFFPVSPQELVCPPTSSPASVSDTTDSFLTTATASTVVETAKKTGKPRKRRYDSDQETFDNEDDDETYVPPSHIRRKSRESRHSAKKKIIYEDISEDEDYKPPRGISVTTDNDDVENRLKASDVFEDVVYRVNKRGRPPKHSRSISSDDYSLLDPQEAKYREMRDRNNEASRKSRYKRKEKEMKLSDQLEVLEIENVKLKAQVEELQKTVERYRDNLMKVMLCGKK